MNAQRELNVSSIDLVPFLIFFLYSYTAAIVSVKSVLTYLIWIGTLHPGFALNQNTLAQLQVLNLHLCGNCQILWIKINNQKVFTTKPLKDVVHGLHMKLVTLA